MNYLFSLVFFLLLGAATAQAQAPAPPEPVMMNFCGVDVPVAAGCTPGSKYQLTCSDFQLTWMYLDFSYLKTFPEQFVKQIEKKHKKSERQTFDCFLLDAPAKGIRLSYPTDTGGMAYELIAYGVAKGQPVLVELIMPLDPEKTADLPATAQLILKLPK